jgi:transcriptional regulator GlxA family with amidase domain
VIDDGDVLTAGGVTSAIDLALHIVERERGAAAAEAGAWRIEHERRGHVLETARRKPQRRLHRKSELMGTRPAAPPTGQTTR